MIADWIAQTPALIAALAVLVLPGLPAALFLRVSGLLRLGAAIVVSLAIVATAAIVAPAVGMRWGILPVVIVAAVVTAIAAVLGFLTRGRRQTEVVRTPRGVWYSIAGTALAWAGLLVLGIVSPSHPTQLYDGLYHLNAVEFILQRSDASPFHMTMTNPSAATSFYPSLWHALVSLVVPAAGAIVPATNVVTITVVALIWPVALAVLAAVLFPAHRSAAVWAPVVALGFSVFPLGFLNWGVLYPNLLGTLLLPLFIAFTVTAVISGAAWPQRTLLALVALAAAAATAIGHPAALLGGVALLVPFALWRVAVGWRSAGTGLRVTLAAATIAGLGALAVVWKFANVTTHEWLPTMTMAQALGEVAFMSPVGRSAGFLLGPLAAIGIWRIVKDRQWWILWSFAVSVGFYLVSAWFPILSVRSAIVGVWYDDTTRVGALIAVFGLPFAGLGAAVLASWLRTLRRTRRSGLLAVAIAAIALAAASHLPMIYADLSFMRNVSYQFTDDSQGLTTDEADLFETAEEYLDDDSLVLGDPLTGAGLLFAYTGHDVVFPHVTGNYGADASYLARFLVTGTPEVCAAVDRLGVTHAFDFGDRELFENHYTVFDGLHGLADSPILTEVTSEGGATLYEITGCP